MEMLVILVFVVGYIAIAFEHPIRVNKTDVKCFNCGGNHHFRDCSRPLDLSKIDCAYQQYFRDKRPLAFRFRPPVNDTETQRLIPTKDDVLQPHSWDATSRRWIIQANPSGPTGGAAHTASEQREQQESKKIGKVGRRSLTRSSETMDDSSTINVPRELAP
ncbi:MAG: hypothetical protein ACKO3B_10800 [Bacteroidota bacterium]